MIEQLYHILGVPMYCDHETIKKAYRQKAKTLHPDINNSANAEELFQEMNEAYKILIQLTPEEAKHLANRLAQNESPKPSNPTPRRTTARPRPKKTDKNYQNFKEKVNNRINFVKAAFIFSLALPFTFGIAAFWGFDADHPYIFYICMGITLFAFFSYFFSMGIKYDPKKKY